MEQEKKEPTEEEIRESRKKFAQMYGQTQIGGKGTEKRKKPVKHRGNKVEVDKKIEAVAKKSQARKLNEVVEVNIFKDDNDMSSMFESCNSLKLIPDISKWDTRNVTDMSSMFENCNSLKSLPDISNWDTRNVANMSFMFEGCDKKLVPKKFK